MVSRAHLDRSHGLELSPTELVVTIPMGYLSDLYGRKKVLYWNICAMALAYAWVMVVGLSAGTLVI